MAMGADLGNAYSDPSYTYIPRYDNATATRERKVKDEPVITNPVPAIGTYSKRKYQPNITEDDLTAVREAQIAQQIYWADKPSNPHGSTAQSNASQQIASKTTGTSTKGLRYDANKLGLHLLPVLALGEVAAVLDYGQKKYSSAFYDATDNWRKGLSWRNTVGSLLRHSFAFLRGEDRDPESGLLHMAHAACNALFLIQFALTSGGTDDRYKEDSPKITPVEGVEDVYKNIKQSF